MRPFAFGDGLGQESLHPLANCMIVWSDGLGI